ncbi:tRNA (adenine(22)-N(1))-methyltransferase [Intestinibacter bartlettii]|uniref:Class I SAM-dependent methyltransferase n=1 Tax=Intestinibacter bartlettii TaxID=261299 RepID=A0ABS6DU91_9FIRM|nr:class I SAM-dependent methyltransferase [Intestinibacter bartlettii]MBU5334832.1 class I SAM-dependent methyltransferase [Intestinibacter bartlettii]MDO5011263.1 class I SAM-dependent methyltransferase [Intestinibacter bartlettii]
MKYLKLTDRLLKIASLVDKDKRIADIGTDHGYIPVYLLNQNKIQYAILGDVNKGPLENAKKEVMRNKLQDKVDLRLGSGIEVLKENEVDEIIIAGMGGMLINNLLKANEKVAHTTEKLILQPMQAPEELRMFLYQNGYKILDEHLVREEHRLYEIIVCKYEGLPPQEIDPIYYEIGQKLIENNDPLLTDFIENKIRINQNVLKKLEGKEGQSIVDKRAALNKKIDTLNDLLNK